MTSQLSPTERSTIRRGAKRARTGRGDLHATLDAGLVCHLAVVVDGSPRVLPTGYGRRGDTLYLHGSTGARSLRDAGEVCVSVTHVDGVVYSRSMMHHSINYRSAVIHGRIQHVDDPAERWEGLRVITEQLAPGSWDYARRPSKKELAATTVLALDLTEAAVKIRTGDPGDDAEDVETNEAWAGVLPLHQSWGAPVPSADMIAELPVPEHVLRRP